MQIKERTTAPDCIFESVEGFKGVCFLNNGIYTIYLKLEEGSDKVDYVECKNVHEAFEHFLEMIRKFKTSDSSELHSRISKTLEKHE